MPLVFLAERGVTYRPGSGVRLGCSLGGRTDLIYSAVVDVSLGADLRESEARSFRSGPWVAVRGARLDPRQPVPGSWDLNPPVSEAESWESHTANSLSRPRLAEGKRISGCRRRSLAHRPHATHIPAYFRHSPRVRTRRTHRSILRLCSASRVSFRAV